MCGACGRRTPTDAWSGALSTTRARWEAARALGGALAGAGHPARVTAVPGGWVVASGTGRQVVASTATQLWAALDAVRPLRGADLDPLRARGGDAAAALLGARAGSRTAEADGRLHP